MNEEAELGVAEPDHAGVELGLRLLGGRIRPKRGTLLDLFDDLVHFTSVFPHKRLTLEVPLVKIEEWRYSGHGRRRR